MKPKKMTNEQISNFTLALSHLLHGGIGIGDALALMKEDETDREYRQFLGQMATGVDEGQSLAAVLRESGRLPAYACTLMEVGERTGKPEQTLEALARYYHDRARMARQLRSALLYPAVLLAVLLGVVAVLLIWVLPVFDSVYAQLGSGLSGISGGLLALGQTLKGALPWLAAVIAVLACAAAVPGIRNAAAGLGKRLLGHRGVFGRIETARFVQALWLCVSSGMTVPEAAALAATLAENKEIRRRCRLCLQQTEDGASLSRALRGSALLPPSQCRLMEAGERCGRSEQVLEDLAKTLLEAGEDDLARTAGRVETAMVTLCSALIGLILLSVLLPLLHIMSAMG